MKVGRIPRIQGNRESGWEFHRIGMGFVLNPFAASLNSRAYSRALQFVALNTYKTAGYSRLSLRDKRAAALRNHAKMNLIQPQTINANLVRRENVEEKATDDRTARAADFQP